jgi:hypothetical protein
MAKQTVDFTKWTIDDIADLLNCALDDGEWHTPSVTGIMIHTNNGVAIYGYCNISKHNTYHYIEHWFNINDYSVKIWREEYVRGKANVNYYKPIYNLQKLVEKLKLHAITTTHEQD